MINYLKQVIEFGHKLKNRIAFYPSLFGIFGLLFAFLLFYLESKGISKYLLDHAPVLVVNDTETARSLLTTFIAGLISIMVFSFSMVMILLNQASSNFSPRILPGLISNRRHQMVLGVYLSTLLYCIFTLVSIEPNGDQYQLPGFSVLLAIFGMTCCLAAFIYFIHSISQAIQVNNIMDRINITAKKRLNQFLETEKDVEADFPDTTDWSEITSNVSGYLQDFSLDGIITVAEEKNIKVHIVCVKSSYIFEDTTLLKVDKNLEQNIIDELRKFFHFSKSELIEDNYLLAFKQITEIAVKAMSPGINDPGTALNAIDYLTELFVLRLQKKDEQIILSQDKHPIIKVRTIKFEDLIYKVMATLRTYCKHDPIIVQKLLRMLCFLKSREDMKLATYKQSIKKEMTNLFNDVSESLSNKADMDIINDLYLKQSSCE